LFSSILCVIFDNTFMKTPLKWDNIFLNIYFNLNN
jgi:hypothetical protein